ncbi:Eco57I restriction-modification methylase domain-containing protein [Clostridium sp. LBM24168]
MKIIETLIKTISTLISNILKQNYENIELVKSTQFKVTYLTFSIINYKKLKKKANLCNNTIELAIREMHSLGLISDGMLEYYEHFQSELNDELYFIFKNTNSEDIDLVNLYQDMLTYDLKINGNVIEMHTDKNSRNVKGSYYTPKEFAINITRKAMDRFIEKNIGIKNYSYTNLDFDKQNNVEKLIENAKIIDLSCGGGDFFFAVLDYISRYISKSHEYCVRVINNMWGIDVDPIAIQLTISNLIKFSGSINNIQRINSHFIIGNPLIFNNKHYNIDEKIELAALSRIYNENMGINLKYMLNNQKFDIILGNPPWEKIRLEEKKFFKNIYPPISEIAQKNHRLVAINNLKDKMPYVYKHYSNIASDYSNIKKIITSNSLLKFSLNGELNTYSLFAELSTTILNRNGVSALVLKGAIVTSSNNSKLFNYFISSNLINSIYCFDNKNKIFNIDSREKFCVIIFEKCGNKLFELAMGLTDMREILSTEMVKMDAKTLLILNPETGMLPNITDKSDIEFLIKAYNKYPRFEEVFPDCKFGRIVHLTAHAEAILKEATDKNLPIYEGKFIEQYDGRFSTFKDMTNEEKYRNKASSRRISLEKDVPKKELPVSRYYIKKDFWKSLSKKYNKKYSLMWRSLTSSTNTRTTIATILPHMPTSQSIQLLQTENTENLILMLALFNSIVFDYFVRLKLSGIDLTQSVIKQIPVPEVIDFEKIILFKNVTKSIKYHIFDRVYTLLHDDERLEGLFSDISYKPIIVYDRFIDKKKVMSEIDILVSKSYKIKLQTLNSIAKHFPNFYSEEQIKKFFSIGQNI